MKKVPKNKKGLKKFRKSSEKKFHLILTSVQKEILEYLTGQKTGYPLTIKQIAKERNTTEKAVRKIRQILIKKGAYSKGFQKVPKSEVTPKPQFNGTSYIRRHAEHWRIKIIWAGQKYEKMRKSGNIIYLDNNTIVLNKKVIQIFSKKDFKADDIDRVNFIANQYWQRFFTRLQDKLAVVLLKEGHHNIKLCRIHYADVHNGIAKRLREKEHKLLRIYDEEDGRLRVITDFSNLKDELETQHPEKASDDMSRLKKHIKAILDDESFDNNNHGK